MISFHSDGKFVKLVKMTCSYQDSIKRHRPEDFDKAKFECSKRENCTAVRKNPCSFSSSPSYDFCEGVPKSLSESSTVGLGVPCIYKKVGPDGTYTYVIEIMNMIITFFTELVVVHRCRILRFDFQCLLKTCYIFLPCGCLRPTQTRV